MLSMACDYRVMAEGPRIGLVETEAVSWVYLIAIGN